MYNNQTTTLSRYMYSNPIAAMYIKTPVPRYSKNPITFFQSVKQNLPILRYISSIKNGYQVVLVYVSQKNMFSNLDV